MEGLDGLYLYFVALAQLYLLCVRFLLGRKVHLKTCGAGSKRGRATPMHVIVP